MLRARRLIPLAVAALGTIASAQSPRAAPWPDRAWPRASPASEGMDSSRLAQARDFALVRGGAGYVVRHGRLVMSWGDSSMRYDVKSATKGIGVTTLGIALLDGKVRLDDPVIRHHPTFGTPPDSNARTGWLGETTLLHLATQTAGFAKRGGYEPLLFEPGTAWSYSDGGPNWLAEALTLVYHRDLAELLAERVFRPIGIDTSALVWRDNLYRPHRIDGIPRREFGAGVSATVDALARIGYLYLHDGRWRDRQLLPASFVERLRRPQTETMHVAVRDPEQSNQPRHYGLLWWNNADGALRGVPRDAYWAWGLYENLIIVIPSLDLVVARAGTRGWDDEGGVGQNVLAPFLVPIVDAARGTSPR